MEFSRGPLLVKLSYTDLTLGYFFCPINTIIEARKLDVRERKGLKITQLVNAFVDHVMHGDRLFKDPHMSEFNNFIKKLKIIFIFKLLSR